MFREADVMIIVFELHSITCVMIIKWGRLWWKYLHSFCVCFYGN